MHSYKKEKKMNQSTVNCNTMTQYDIDIFIISWLIMPAMI